MIKRNLSLLVKKLGKSDWLFFSGFAVEVYTRGKRQAGVDVDILVRETDIDKLAGRFSSKAKRRKFNKADFVVEDYAFSAKYSGLELEVTSGFPPKRMKDGTIKRVFNNKVKVNYLDINIFVEPVEELVVFKAHMHRSKDIRDLKLLKGMNIDNNLLFKFAKDWGAEKRILRVLKDCGYQLN